MAAVVVSAIHWVAKWGALCVALAPPPSAAHPAAAHTAPGPPPQAVGVTCEPHVASYTLSDRDLFLVFATDGVCDVMTNDEVRLLAGRDAPMCRSGLARPEASAPGVATAGGGICGRAQGARR